ncbi:MAG: RagB/SusD family nutrient uptake outer membrane protein [Prolixibacteraceae bacterium]
MKINSLKILLPFLFLGSIISSCETFTEPGDDNQYTEDRVLKDPAFAEGILLNGYLALPRSYNLEEEVATDDAVTNNISSRYRRMATGEWSAKFNPLDIWADTYTDIANLNYFLSVVESVEWSWQSPLRNELFIKKHKGEALALRAYLYYRLLVRYGGIGQDNNLLGVPLVTTPLSINDNWKLPRNTYQECVDQIYADFDAAIVLLPENWENKTGTDEESLAHNKVNGTQNANRINGKIAKALKAKIALHVASPAFNNGTFNEAKYAGAATLTGALLAEQGGISGLSTDLRIYDADTDITNKDILWRNDFVTNNTLESQNYPPSLFGEGRINPSQNLVNAFPMKNGYPISASTSGFNPSSPYANRDPRLAYFILCNGASLRSTIINTGVNSPTSDGLNKVPDFSTRTGYYLLKWLRVNVNMDPATKTTARHFFTHVRFTELYLNYAEAANEAWGPEGDPNGYGFTARTIIQAIRKRAGITQPDKYLASLTDKESVRELIRNERRLELCFEGARFWDLRRWQLTLDEKAKGVSIDGTVFTTIDVEERVYPAHGAYCPIPNEEILKYDGLIQNKGW